MTYLKLRAIRGGDRSELAISVRGFGHDHLVHLPKRSY